MVVQAPVWARIGRSRLGFRLRGPAPPRLPWPFPADSRQRAAHGPAGSLPLRVVLPGFAFGVVADGVSRSMSGRCARGGLVVRFLKRAVLFEVGEDGADRVGFFDAGHEPERAATVDARAHVDVEDALEALCLRSSSDSAPSECGGLCSPRSIPRRWEDVCRARRV